MADGRVKDSESEPNGNEPLLTYELTYKDVVEILKLIDSSACREVRIELGDLKLTVVKRGYPVATPVAVSPELDPAQVSSAKINPASGDREKDGAKKEGS